MVAEDVIVVDRMYLEARIELWYLKTIIRRVSVVFLPLEYRHCFHQLGALLVLLSHLIAIMGVDIGIWMYCKYFYTNKMPENISSNLLPLFLNWGSLYILNKNFTVLQVIASFLYLSKVNVYLQTKAYRYRLVY